MLSATDARTQNISSTLVETEIALLNLNILATNGIDTIAVINRATVTDVNTVMVTGTPMTLSNVYYQVWQDVIVNNLAQYQMNKVIDYYTKLGYTISRKSNDGEYLYWQISW